jgi:excinuclease UvrABC helicase subunit UvrB
MDAPKISQVENRGRVWHALRGQATVQRVLVHALTRRMATGLQDFHATERPKIAVRAL